MSHLVGSSERLYPCSLEFFEGLAPLFDLLVEFFQNVKSIMVKFRLSQGLTKSAITLSLRSGVNGRRQMTHSLFDEGSWIKEEGDCGLMKGGHLLGRQVEKCLGCMDKITHCFRSK